ncbi:MAG: hypothetical protein H6807_13345 [Planctomycetes bacterium]|nr:hypothetical protein [Planctomycetota bacterium]
METAREGLERFPHSEDLRDILRHTWRQTKTLRIEQLRRQCHECQDELPFAELVQIYLECEEYDEAIEVAEELSRRLPESLRGPLMQADVLLRRFYKDHVAADARRAVALLKRVTDDREGDFEANFLLARVYHYVGATSKALFHVYRALDVEPDHEESRALHRLLINMPLEDGDENLLFRAVEERDRGNTQRAADPEAAAAEASRRLELKKNLGRLSQLVGVTRAAFVSDDWTFVAENGECRLLEEDATDALCDIARGFRAAAALSTKRMGLGSFHSSQLMAGDHTLQFHAVGRTVLLVESDKPARIDVIKQECVDFVASCLRKSGELLHA